MDNCGTPGALEDAVFQIPVTTHSRRDLVRRGALAGAAIVAGAPLALAGVEAAQAAPSQALDRKILNFALLLEYLQAAFYSEAVSRGRLRGDVRSFAETVAEHERAHVAYLRKALGSTARARPQFHFRGATGDERKFLRNAVLLENIGVSAYNGQAANLTKPALEAAAEIVSVEGRHAAWVSDLAGEDPAPRAADPGASAAEVVAQLKRTGFVR
jgi:rubrerythrin